MNDLGRCAGADKLWHFDVMCEGKLLESKQ